MEIGFLRRNVEKCGGDRVPQKKCGGDRVPQKNWHVKHQNKNGDVTFKIRVYCSHSTTAVNYSVCMVWRYSSGMEYVQ